MKIAIIGSGISGLASAYMLHNDHELVIYEANDYVGGHTHTIDVTTSSGEYKVDTGFIVFNEQTYPNFCKILDSLGVESQPTSMSFSVKSLIDGLEYNGDGLNTFFGQRKNIFQPTIYRIIRDMFRFNRQMEELIGSDRDNRSLAVYLRENNYSEDFLTYFILPMTAALWSASREEAEDFPVALFARFFKNHGIFNLRNRIPWKVITGGSSAYVEKITQLFGERIRLNCGVTRVSRAEGRVQVETGQGEEQFDRVIFAVHSDQALSLLADPSESEREILGTIGYQRNVVQLHTDTSVMPCRKNLWAAWNYLIPKETEKNSNVTYDMNILQSIVSPEEFLVSLNQNDQIDPGAVLGEYVYHHPAYTPQVPAAQDRHAEINGVNNTHYCGAYWGYGFHEDGVRSAIAACSSLGGRIE